MRLLFFSPRCDRTGAELALFRLICNADRETTKMAVACGARGELSKNFPRDVPVFHYWHALSFADVAFNDSSPGSSFAHTAFNGMLRLIHARARPDAWYINTTVQPSVVALARELKIPCILHTHELGFGSPLLRPRDIENMVSYPKLIIAGSACAADAMRVLGRRDNIEVCGGPIDLGAIRVDVEKSEKIRRDLKIPTGEFVWAMSGTRDHNKNPAGFVRIASELLKQEPNSYFLWIGGTDTGDGLYAQALARKLNIDRKISWVPERTEDYFDYLNVADGFVLTSFRESLSLVTLEAAALGKPFVSFNSGGPKEIFRDGMGAVVDSWNAKDLITAMLQVMRGEIYLDANISRARASEFDVSVIVRQWEENIRRHFTTQPEARRASPQS
jgi:glycosyltransferase involved in cell wall biosynthesis